MIEPVVFYVKCRPQDADAWPIARDHRIVFVGYPPWREYETYKNAKSGWQQALYNIVEEPQCGRRVEGVSRGYRAAISQNATLAASVYPGSLVMVPRPGHGVCYVGDILDRLHVVDEPSWACAYLDLRRQQGLGFDPIGDHVADVVQCWTVGAWTEHPFGLIPRWITYRLLSRNTSGVVYDFPELGLRAHATVNSIRVPRTGEAAEVQDAHLIARRLVELVGPSAFEHLAVHLLQLESGMDVRWHHIGGSGDGGVDGIGISPNGSVSGILQCKWHYGGDLQVLVRQALRIRERWPDSKVVVAVLLGSTERPDNLPDDVQILLLDDVASLVQKHRKCLPIAQSLGLTDAAS